MTWNDPLGHVVALGGGTGLPAVLRGFRDHVMAGRLRKLTAVVAMTDDGGSSGRLRRTRGLPPPGDIRNCLVALANDQTLLSDLFQHRYGGRDEVGGHSLGNLILAALAEQSGSFMKAVEVSSRVLRTAGRILPATLDNVSLLAIMEDGSRIRGETNISSSNKTVDRISILPESAQPTPGITEAIGEADIVAIGPGSLFTSILPTLVHRRTSTALLETTAVRVLIANLSHELGAAAKLDLADHLKMIEKHIGGRCVDMVLVNRSPIPRTTVQRYESEGTPVLTWSGETAADVPVLPWDLLADERKLRHEPERVAAGVYAAWELVKDRHVVAPESAVRKAQEWL